MEHRIHGTTMPVLEIDLQPGESIVSEAGELSWMNSAIELETSTQKGGGGGVFGAFKRVASGGSLFMTEYTAKGGQGMVAFATRVPGEILPIEIKGDQTYMIHRHGFLCGTPGVELTIGFQRSLGAGVFGGEGFRLQKLSGECTAWIELDGEVVTYDLAPGETLRVHPGHVGMFDSTISFDITRIKGVKNMIFGADGIFLAALTGPGKVWLQSLPLANLAHALQPYLVESEGSAVGVGAVAGGLLKGLSK
jgi:uncharacterized protein (TIGR00266 family)